MHGELAAALDAAAADAAVRCVVLTGAGRAFCAGQDLADPAVAPTSSPAPAHRRRRRLIERFYKPLALRVRAMPVPVIAAVNGVAAGAGANLALCCDLVVAARSASFIQAFTKIGLVPDCGGTWLLPRLVGRARALGLAMLGDKLPADEAERIGLIWKCVDDAAFEAEVAGAGAAAGRDADARAGATRAAIDAAQQLDFAAALSHEARAAARARRRARLPRRRRRVLRQARRRSSPTAEPMDARTPPALGRAVARRACSPPTAPRAALGMADHRHRRPAARPLTMTVRDDMLNGHDICHGGFITTLADSAFAFACNSYNDRHRRRRASTVDFLAPAHGGDVLTARGVEASQRRPHRRLRHRRHQPARRARRAVPRPLAQPSRASRPVATDRREGARMPVEATPARRPRADRARQPRRAAGAAAASACNGRLQHAYDNVAALPRRPSTPRASIPPT